MWIAAHGFDHVQIPVDAEEWFDSTGALLEPRVRPFEAILTVANDRGLGVVLVYSANYSLPFVGDDPFDAAQAARRTAEWGTIAARFARVGDGLRFDADERLWPVSSRPAERYRGYLRAIRESSPNRFLYLSAPVADSETADPYVGSNAAFLDSLGLAGFDRAVGVSLVYWEPRVFVWQNPAQPQPVRFPGSVPDFREVPQPFGADSAAGGGFAGVYARLARAASGSRISEDTVDHDLAMMAAWRDRNAPGRELYIRRFGINLAHALSDSASVGRYLRAVTGSARKHGIGWAVYDYDTGKGFGHRTASPLRSIAGYRSAIRRGRQGADEGGAWMVATAPSLSRRHAAARSGPAGVSFAVAGLGQATFRALAQAPARLGSRSNR
jgi:hypothetical protein